MQSFTNYRERTQRNLSKLAYHLQPRYLIHAIALAGLADIAVNSMSGNLPGLLGAVGGGVGIEMLGHFLSKLDENESIDAEFITSFCKALDESGIEKWLSKTDLRDELERIAQIIGTALQLHENTVVNKVLSGISHYEHLRTGAIKQLQEDVIHRFDPEKRYLTRLIHKCESRDGVIEYVNLSGSVNLIINVDAGKRYEQRRVIDPAFEQRPKRFLPTTKSQAKVRTENVENLRGLIEKHRIFALLGDPGAGKTTTLRRMAVDLAWRRLQDASAPIPLYLELPQWKGGDINSFLRSHWELDIDLFASVVEGNVWVFLDGLNEMGASGYQKAGELREWLHGRNYPEYFAVTCRLGDYEDPFESDEEETLSLGITTIQISPLSDEKIRDFAKKYLLPDELDGFLNYVASFKSREDDEFIDEEDNDETQVLEEKSLSKFTQNPFMLRGLIFLYKDTSDGELPRNTGAILEGLVWHLWSRERDRQTTGWIDYQAMLSQLSKLAYHMIEAEIGTSIPLSVAETFVSHEAFPAMESANLIEVSNEELRFYHQLMQEYFAALTLKEICAARGAIPDEIIEPPNEWHIDLRLFDTAVEMGMEYFKNMFPYESKWKQVVIALCGIVDDVDPIIQQIAENNLFLVVDCAISGVEISEQTKSKIVSSLKRVVSDADDWAWGERLWFADELRRFGFKPESVEDKVEYYAGLMDWESVQELGEDAIPTLLKIAKQWGDESYYSEGIHGCLQELGVHLYDLLQYLLENNKDPAFDLVDKLQEDALPDLIAGLEHWNSDVREISAELVAYLAETVGYLSPSRWDVIPKLIECLQDPSWFVAKAAANALWRIGTPDSIKAAEQFWRDQQV